MYFPNEDLANFRGDGVASTPSPRCDAAVVVAVVAAT
jgi:hypothetical protein